MSEETPRKYALSDIDDPELAALDVCLKIIGGLEGVHVRRRVVDYLTHKIEQEERLLRAAQRLQFPAQESPDAG